MDLNFKGQHVVVTGGAQSIGFEIARQFAASGARVSIFDYKEDTLDSAVKQLNNKGYTVHPFIVNVCNKEAVDRTVAEAEALAPVDILINNAGICLVTPFLNISQEEWNKTIRINLSGAFFVAQSICRHMAKRKKGVVLNMSSKNGLDGEFGHAHYNASKAGLVLLSKTMAIELAHLGIRVNAICPGYVRSNMNSNVDSDEFVDAFAKRYIPMDRVGKVTDVAPLILFLSSDKAEYITGQFFVIDGGQLAGQKPWDWMLEDIKV